MQIHSLCSVCVHSSLVILVFNVVPGTMCVHCMATGSQGTTVRHRRRIFGPIFYSPSFFFSFF